MSARPATSVRPPTAGLTTEATGGGLRALLPGLALVVAGVALAAGVHALLPPLGMATAAVALGVVSANSRAMTLAMRPGLQISSRRVLRIGVALLGLQLGITEVLALGAPTLLIVVAVVAVTFVGTRWLGRLLGLSPGAALLIATGTAVCGASAIAAMDGVTEEREEDVANALAMVTVFGSIAIVLLPWLRQPLGLTPHAFGMWVGASVHEVAQVVATATPVPGAVAIATVVKLARIVTLAPLIAVMSVMRRRQGAPAGTQRPPIVPLFVVGFLVLVAVRTMGVLPTAVLDGVKTLDGYLLAAGLFALGTGVRLSTMRQTGVRATVLGLLAWLLALTTAYVGVRLTA
jgi:uncharacterized integral membrane protein (TIGR00698 family)